MKPSWVGPQHTASNQLVGVVPVDRARGGGKRHRSTPPPRAHRARRPARGRTATTCMSIAPVHSGRWMARRWAATPPDRCAPRSCAMSVHAAPWASVWRGRSRDVASSPSSRARRRLLLCFSNLRFNGACPDPAPVGRARYRAAAAGSEGGKNGARIFGACQDGCFGGYPRDPSANQRDTARHQFAKKNVVISVVVAFHQVAGSAIECHSAKIIDRCIRNWTALSPCHVLALPRQHSGNGTRTSPFPASTSPQVHHFAMISR